MNTLQMISNYRDTADYRFSFNCLAHEVFGIDFEKWYQAGFWTNRYICYSYIDNGKVVSNVSINKLTLVINEEKHSALQIGTVMTHPAYRKRGLAGNLLKTVLDEFEDLYDIIYLFPEEDALEFYRKFGFHSTEDVKFILDAHPVITNNANVKKLDLTQPEDVKLFVSLIAERSSLSRIFGVDDAQHVLSWYSVGMMADKLYYLVDLDCLAVFKVSQNVLHLFDVISRERVSFYEVFQRIASEEVSKVVFYFTPDFADVDGRILQSEPNEIMFFKTDSLQLPRVFAYPITAHA